MFPMSTVIPKDGFITEKNIFPLGKIQCLILVGPEHSLSSLRNYRERFPDASVTCIPYFLRILLIVLGDIVALQPDMNSVHTCGSQSLLFAIEILFIILSCLCDNFRGLPE